MLSLCKKCVQHVQSTGQKAVSVYTHLPHTHVDFRGDIQAWWEKVMSFTTQSSISTPAFPTLQTACIPLESRHLSPSSTQPITTMTIYK